MSKTVIKGLAVVASGGTAIGNITSATLTITTTTVDSTVLGETAGHDEVALYLTKELTLEGFTGSLQTGKNVSWSFTAGSDDLGDDGTGMVVSQSVSADPGSLAKVNVTIRTFAQVPA